uniref:Uncharacterized protein n=1 Tax=Arundo donax TaxID=35708 RepID=A0A0A9EFA9_ARUDO
MERPWRQPIFVSNFTPIEFVVGTTNSSGIGPGIADGLSFCSFDACFRANSLAVKPKVSYC